MDERVTFIVHEMARGLLEVGDCSYSCPHCREESERTKRNIETDEIDHTPDCPVVVARTLLLEWGTPLGIYHVSSEMRMYGFHEKPTGEWRPCDGYTLATSEQEAIRYNEDDNTRNSRATFVRLFPLEGV